MPSEHGSAQPDGLRREHIVAAALVTAVTIVLGFASGFGVREAGATAGPPSSPGGAVAAPPGAQQITPPSAGTVPPGAVRPGGSQVGVRPGSYVRGNSAQASPAQGNQGNQGGFESGLGQSSAGLPGAGPTGPAGAGPAAPPAGPVDSAAQCQPGILDAILALIAQVLGGTEPATALSDAGAVTMPIEMTPTTVAPTAVTPTAGRGAAAQPDAAILTTFLPVGDSAVPVVGLAPLLETVAARRDALALPATPLGVLQPAVVPASGPPAADDADPTTPDGQLSQLAALLAPLGLRLDLVNGTADPMLLPVLGSLGCPAEPPADPQAATANPQAVGPRGGVR